MIKKGTRPWRQSGISTRSTPPCRPPRLRSPSPAGKARPSRTHLSLITPLPPSPSHPPTLHPRLRMLAASINITLTVVTLVEKKGARTVLALSFVTSFFPSVRPSLFLLVFFIIKISIVWMFSPPSCSTRAEQLFFFIFLRRNLHVLWV